MINITTLAWISVGYVCGSLPFGVWLPMIMGHGDPRTMGSKNIGATNVYRLAGMSVALLVYVCDALKGLIPTVMAPSDHRLFVGFSCLLGHIFSLFLKGKGGKGVATACGVLSVVLPQPMMAAFLVWGAVIKITRYMSLACLISAGFITAWTWTMPYSLHTRLFSTMVTIVLIWSHRSNIRRLLSGTESKIV